MALACPHRIPEREGRATGHPPVHRHHIHMHTAPTRRPAPSARTGHPCPTHILGLATSQKMSTPPPSPPRVPLPWSSNSPHAYPPPCSRWSTNSPHAPTPPWPGTPHTSEQQIERQWQRLPDRETVKLAYMLVKGVYSPSYSSHTGPRTGPSRLARHAMASLHVVYRTPVRRRLEAWFEDCKGQIRLLPLTCLDV